MYFMNLSGFISHKTRKAHRQISKALFNGIKLKFNDKFNDTIDANAVANNTNILNTLKNTLDSSLKSQINEESLNNKRKDILKAILGPDGVANQLSKSIYTSGRSNFKKISKQLKKIEYKEDNTLYLNNRTISHATIGKLLRNLKKYLKMNDEAIGDTDDNTDDNIIPDINIESNTYTNVNTKFKEGGLIARLKIFICLLLIYYLMAEKANLEPTNYSSSSSSSTSTTAPKMPPASPPVAPHNFKLDPTPSSSSSSSSSSSAPRDLPAPKVVHPGIIDPTTATKKGIICYAKSKYNAIKTKCNYEECKTCLTENVEAGIERLNNTGVIIIKYDAKTFFASKGVNDPRRTNKYPSSNEVNFVYDVPEKYCHVEDYSEQEPICVTDTSKSTPATLWFYRGFSLPAIFAVNKALQGEGKGELNPNSTAVQSAGNATSPGGDALMGSGTQEESLQFDTEAYLFINTKKAYEEYYLKNREAMKAQFESSNKSQCSVDAWNKTGIFSRGIYSSGVGLRGGNGATINIITTAAADYNEKHDGTYMGPIKDSDGTFTSYKKQLITYWNTILRIAYTKGNKNIVLTTGGGGAYNGNNEEIISALSTVLAQYGPSGSVCWAKCFDNIIFASESSDLVETKLCQPYRANFGASYVKSV